MLTLFRALLALVAAITVCVAGWAGLQALEVKAPPLASAPVDLRVPDAVPPAPKPPLATVPTVTEASASRPDAHLRQAATVGLNGEPSSVPLCLTVFSGWSNAPLAHRDIDTAALAAGSITFPSLPPGEHWATLVAAAAPSAASYLTRARLRVPAAAPVTLDVGARWIRVKVRQTGAPVADALVRLARLDDPAWVQPAGPPGDDVAALTNRAGEVQIGPLGAGRYRASVVGESPPAVEFELPGDTAVEISLPDRR